MMRPAQAPNPMMMAKQGQRGMPMQGGGAPQDPRLAGIRQGVMGGGSAPQMPPGMPGAQRTAPRGPAQPSSYGQARSTQRPLPAGGLFGK